MILLTPALVGLLALGGILVAFYVWRARHQRHLTSTTMLWQEALTELQQRPAWRPPWRHLLLLLQLLALLLLTLALAQPAIPSATPQHLILIMDTSVQMGATDVAVKTTGGAANASSESRFDAARAEARMLIVQMKDDDIASLVLAGPVARVIDTTANQKTLTGELGHLAPSLGQADLTDALTLAAMTGAADRTRKPRIVVMTSPTAVVPALHGWPATAQPDVRRFGRSDDDQGIISMTSRCPSTGQTCEIFARVGNYASMQVVEPVTLWVDGQAQGTQSLVLSAHTTTDLVTQVPRNASIIRLTLNRHDILATDNAALVSVSHARQSVVLVVSDDPSAIDRALHDLPNVQVIDENTSDYSSDTNTNPPDVTIFDSFYPQTTPSGNLFLINIPQDNNLLPYDHDLSDTQPSTLQTDHPLLAGIDLGPLVLARSAAYSPPLPTWLEPVVSSAVGPLVLAGTTASGQKTLVWGFGLGDTNLPRLSAFPLLIRNAIAWLAPPVPTVAVPGDVLAAPILHGATQLRLTGPTGHVITPALINPNNELFAPDAYNRVGIYQLHQEGANPPVPDELIVANAQPPALDNATAAASVSSSGNGLQLPDLQAISDHAGIIDLRLWMLVVALFVLGGEWWYYAVRT